MPEVAGNSSAVDVTAAESVESVDAGARVAAQPVDPRRRLAALPRAVGGEIERRERPGVWVAAAIVVAAYVALALLSAVVPGLAWLQQLPWWLSSVLIGIGAGVSAALVPLLIVPRRVIDAWSALTWVGLDGQAEWTRRTGTDYPESDADCERWLAEHPETDANRLDRASLLLALDRPAEAEVVLARHQHEGGSQAFLAAQLRWFSAFMSDRPEQRLLDRCRRLAGAYTAGSRDGRVALAAVAHLEAARAYALDEDWIGPLAEGRRALGPLTRGVVRRRLLAPRIVPYSIASVVIGAVLIAARLIIDAM